MSAIEEANRQWREKRFQRTCKKYDREMKSFSKLLDSKDGIISGLFVSFMAISFAAGKSKRAELDAALASASEATGIPFKAWNAFAQIAIEMVHLHRAEVGFVNGGDDD
jgi:hypothetical protein